MSSWSRIKESCTIYALLKYAFELVDILIDRTEVYFDFVFVSTNLNQVFIALIYLSFYLLYFYFELPHDFLLVHVRLLQRNIQKCDLISLFDSDKVVEGFLHLIYLSGWFFVLLPPANTIVLIEVLQPRTFVEI